MRIQYKIVALSLVCGLCVCVIDASLDRLLFYEGTFWELLVASPPTQELYVRTTIIGFFVVFGLFIARCAGKREKAERALRNSHSFLQTVIDGVPDGVMVIDLDHHIVLSNQPSEQLAEETNGAPGAMLCYQVSHHRSVPCDGLEHPCPLRQVVETKKAATTTHTHFTTDGDEIVMEIRAAPVFDEAGEVVQIIESFRDITERKQAKERLQVSEERFRNAFETSGIGMGLVGLDGCWLKVNTALCEIVGYTDSELLTKTFQDITHPDDLEPDLDYVRQLVAGEIPNYHMEKRYIHKDGHNVWIILSVSLVRDSAGNPMYFVSQINDITDRRQAEEELIRYQTQLRSLVSQLALTAERERKEIEAVLHDDLLQRLVLCKMRLDELGKSETLTDPATSLGEISESICEMLKSARALTFDLTSPVLYDIGLEAAIRDWLDREISGKYDIVLEFEDDGRNRQLSNDLRVMLYRAVRELCTNIVKHSQAERARVSIRGRGDDMEIIVEDDGIGMEVHESRSDAVDFSDRGGLGLFGIRERLDHFGASMKIESGAGVGTRISIIVPPHYQKA
ncbi:MAG: PAS domain S-box protein [Phycisphaerales bacterium]|nr:MAG: PAS domain S-box protein [Phycisphaerales bacterium]